MFSAFIVTVFVSALIQSGFSQAPEKECEDCGDQIETCLENMREPIGEQEPYEVEGPDPCKKCVASEVKTIRKDGEICVQKMNDGSKQQDMELGFEKLHAVCNCEFKNPDGSVDEGQMIADWEKNVRVITVLSIKDGSCSVVKGDVNCENPNPDCQIPKEDMTITCEGSDSFKEKCNAQKDEVMPKVFLSVSKSVVPVAATKQINENPEYVKQMSCDVD